MASSLQAACSTPHLHALEFLIRVHSLGLALLVQLSLLLSQLALILLQGHLLQAEETGGNGI